MKGLLLKGLLLKGLLLKGPLLKGLLLKGPLLKGLLLKAPLLKENFCAHLHRCWYHTQNNKALPSPASFSSSSTR